MGKRLVAVVLALGLGLAAVLSAPPATARANDFPTACPQLTDSIYRLYSAYFLRDPDATGWAYWTGVFGSGRNTNLDVVSDSFARSAEFQVRYGQLSNQDFVRLVYNNVLQREPDPGGFQHWTGSLDRGYPRGSVMIAFSESAEYVARTHTIQPQAGYLLWYDRGFRMFCGHGLNVLGGTVDITVPPPKAAPYYADVVLMNASPDPSLHMTGFVSTLGGPATPAIFAGFNGGESVYIANIALTSRNTAIRITATNTVYWSVVFYDAPPAATRDGWPWIYRWQPPTNSQVQLTGGVNITDLSRFH